MVKHSLQFSIFATTIFQDFRDLKHSRKYLLRATMFKGHISIVKVKYLHTVLAKMNITSTVL